MQCCTICGNLLSFLLAHFVWINALHSTEYVLLILISFLFLLKRKHTGNMRFCFALFMIKISSPSKQVSNLIKVYVFFKHKTILELCNRVHLKIKHTTNISLKTLQNPKNKSKHMMLLTKCSTMKQKVWKWCRSSKPYRIEFYLLQTCH